MEKLGAGKIEKSCKQCKKGFVSWKIHNSIFCSRECQRKGRSKSPKILISFKCKECGTDSKRRKGAGGTFSFCSIPCMAKYRGRTMSGENHPFWKGGISDRPYSAKKAIKLAKSLKKECQECGSSENLQGHHIIKYSERPDLCDDINNIEIICASCHAREHPEIANMIAIPRFKTGIYKSCKICDSEFYVIKSLIKSAKFCSRKCQLSNLHCLLRSKNEKIYTESSSCSF